MLSSRRRLRTRRNGFRTLAERDSPAGPGAPEAQRTTGQDSHFLSVPSCPSRLAGPTNNGTRDMSRTVRVVTRREEWPKLLGHLIADHADEVFARVKYGRARPNLGRRRLMPQLLFRGTERRSYPNSPRRFGGSGGGRSWGLRRLKRTVARVM